MKGSKRKGRKKSSIEAKPVSKDTHEKEDVDDVDMEDAEIVEKYSGENELENSDQDKESEEKRENEANDESESEGEDGRSSKVNEGLGAVIEEGDDGLDSEGELEALAISDLPSNVVKLSVNNEQALTQKLDEIAMFSNGELSFVESLSVPNNAKNDEEFDDELAVDDLKRENAFAEYATDAVHAGLEMLRSMKIKFRRPGDYFAEMVKSDTHMQKVKSRLIAQKESISAAEKRRKQRTSKKKSKDVQIAKEQQRKAQTKREIENITQVRKERLKKRSESGKGISINADGTIQGAADSDDDFPVDLLDIEQVDPSLYVKGASKGRRSGPQASGKGSSKGNKSQKGRGRSSPSSGKPRYGPKLSGGIGKKRKGSKPRLGKTRRAQAKAK